MCAVHALDSVAPLHKPWLALYGGWNLALPSLGSWAGRVSRPIGYFPDSRSHLPTRQWNASSLQVWAIARADAWEESSTVLGAQAQQISASELSTSVQTLDQEYF